MANFSLGDFARNTLVVPDIAPDLSGMQLLNQVSRQAGAIADRSLKEWKTAEVNQATTEGKIAGTQPNVKYRPGGTLSADAYNAAARKSLSTMTELTSSIGMGELAQVHKNDPAMFQEKSTEFIDTVTQGLRDTGDVAMANETKASMTLSAQTKGYEISKVYQAAQIDKIKADNTMLLHTLKVNTNVGSGGLFSPDPEEQGIALTNFAVNKKLYDASLHLVLPDGTPVYTAEGIQKRQQAFHTDFYTGAVQNWVSEANLSVNDLKRIKDGTLEVEIPGVGSINVMAEIGVDDYDTKVRRYTVTKIREKVAAQSKLLQVEKQTLALRSKANDIALLANIYDGVPTSAATIHNNVRDGLVSLGTAKSALKMINDPDTIKDDKVLVADLKVQQIQGIDITADVKSNAHRIGGASYKALLAGSAKNQKTMQSEDEKWIVREMIKKSPYGVENPKSIRLAGDTVDSYRQKIRDGASPEKAFEEIRATMDALKDRVNRRAFNSVPKYTVISDGTIDLALTVDATALARKNGLITEEQFQIEMARLRDIKQTKRGVKTDG
jgi:hypothetical protein